MRVQKQIIASLGLIVTLLLIALLQFPNDTVEPDAPELVAQMIGAENCDAPCFFGQSLRGATVEQAQKILEETPLGLQFFESQNSPLQLMFTQRCIWSR